MVYAPGIVGPLRHRVTLQTRIAAGLPTGDLGADFSWAEIDTVWASVMALGGAQAEIAGRPQSDARYAVTIRYTSAVAADDRMLWRGEAYDITAVQDPDGRQQWLTLECTRHAD